MIAASRRPWLLLRARALGAVPAPRAAGVLALSLFLLFSQALGCATNPVSGKRQVILMSEEEEKRIDAEAARQVEAQIGLVDDPELSAYVDEIGQALAKHSPRQDVRYHFHVIAMDEPNAFALPGGHIYISRGLLALLNSEAELANVLGHEIGHVAARHAAQRDAMMKMMAVLNTIGMIGAGVGGARANGNGGPVGQPGLYAYSRKQESEADEIGQNLAVATGIDPMGMADLLRSLDASERLHRGFSRSTGYFDSHPAARERAAEAATAADARRFEPDFAIAASRGDFLERMAGLSLGTPASEGVIDGSTFLHADLDFALRFPQGWEIVNEHTAVYAVSPGREAAVILELQGEGDDPEAAAHSFVGGAKAAVASPISIGEFPAYRLRAEMPTAAGRTLADVTWIAHGGHIYRLSGFALRGRFDRWAGVFRNFPRSFRRLDEDELDSITDLRLRVVAAEDGETLDELSRRTGNEWAVTETAVHNAMRPGQPLEAGDMIKIAVREPYYPAREREQSGPRTDTPTESAGAGVGTADPLAGSGTWSPRP